MADRFGKVISQIVNDNRGQVGPDMVVWIPGQLIGGLVAAGTMFGLLTIGVPERFAWVVFFVVFFVVGQLAWGTLHEVRNEGETNA